MDVRQKRQSAARSDRVAVRLNSDVGGTGPGSCDPAAPSGGVARMPGPRGRGSASNESGRFEVLSYKSAGEDGFEIGEEAELPPERVETLLIPDSTRSIIARNQSPDIPFDRSINPYRGCEHGCSYCYARPSHAFLGHSPGLDFETHLYTKPNASALLDKTLRKPGYRPQPLALGSNTDPYQPVEKDLRITRSILEVLAAFQHPVMITTKGALVTRDRDILGPMAAHGLAKASISVTTLNNRLARAMEPRASSPPLRLKAISDLAAAGIPTAVSMGPIIPGLNDHEIEAILEAACEAGAIAATYVLLRMPHEIKDLFREWLEGAVPGRAARVISLLQQMRGGKDYDPEWHKRMTGEGPLAALIKTRFTKARARLGLGGHGSPLDTTRFAVPPAPGDQLQLL